MELEVMPTVGPLTPGTVRQEDDLLSSLIFLNVMSGQTLASDTAMAGISCDLLLNGFSFFIRTAVQEFDIDSPIELLEAEPSFGVDIAVLAAGWEHQGISYMLSPADVRSSYSVELTRIACAMARACKGAIAFISPYFDDNCPPGVYMPDAFELRRGLASP